MDLSKLTPAPWESVTILSAGERDTPDGGHEMWSESPWRVINGPPQRISDAMLCRRAFTNATDTEFMALARGAFDVMMRRKWEPEAWLAEGDVWGVDSAVASLPAELYAMRWPDPFTALVEADRWYVENVEGK